MKRRMRHTCSDISAFCWQLCKGQEYVCIRLWTTPQPHSTQRPTLAPAKIKGSFASARSGSHRYVCNKRARCTRKAFSKVPKAFSKVWRLSFLLFGHRQWRPLSFHCISSHHFCGHRQWQPFYVCTHTFHLNSSHHFYLVTLCGDSVFSTHARIC